jgi:hypothetical protein
MAFDMAIFVSKRLQRPAAALLCLIAVQGLVSLSTCHPELTPAASAARVHLR